MPLALLALAVGAFALGTTEFVIMGLLPEVAEGLGVSISSAGYLISAYALGVVVGAPLLTAMATRLPRKHVLILFMGLFALGNLATVLAPTYETVFVSRVVAGLPHGAFFGAGALAAAQMAGPARQGRAVARMFLGLTVANIIGVPVGTLLGQELGWRAAFLVVTVIAVLAMAGIAVFVPRLARTGSGRLMPEVRALGNTQVLLGLLSAVFGFAGVFAVYSYIAPMMTELAGLGDRGVTVVLALFGIGMTLGSLIVGPLADRALRPTIYIALGSLAAVLALFTLTVHNPWTAMASVVVLGAVGFGVTTPLQLLVMNKAGAAPTLASAANHSAFNLANAGGAWLGGVGISAGLGLASPAAIGAVLAVAGLGVAVTAGFLDRDRATATSVRETSGVA
ncbi:MFS transporter [Nocardiopsis lambiniae]|uniref:MFS transporter n=1 Tax=Nocardiopsis lambiniae TaxID=3075539 RepID=A0ABU2MHG1_9ACTN|nr:MFS transporter [Nocardiopsis sp. DSM 44743]MDT0332062.1 MFS transporter [Nocardiopsis sp. DSM 44743]